MRPRRAKRHSSDSLIVRPGSRGVSLRAVVFGGLGILCAYMAFALAVSGVARHRSPQNALAFVPKEGIALATQADLALVNGVKASPLVMQRDARAALRNMPLNSKAVRLLAISMGLQGKDPLADRLLDQAANLTRRDLLTQVLLIEAAIRRDDLHDALKHFDIALRSSANAPQILFPRLSNGIANPEGRAALKPYIRAKSSWPLEFLYYAKDNRDDLAPLVDLVIETGGVADAVKQRAFDAALLEALFQKQNYADLKRLFGRIPGAKLELLTSAALNTADVSRRFGPAAWQPLDDAESGASPSGGKGAPAALSIYANSGTTGPVAQKLLFLTPGRYRFAFRVASIDRGEGGSIGWQMHCLEPAASQPFWRMESLYRSTTSFVDVDATCRVQRLQIWASGGSGQTGMEADISAVSLDRGDKTASRSSISIN